MFVYTYVYICTCSQKNNLKVFIIGCEIMDNWIFYILYSNFWIFYNKQLLIFKVDKNKDAIKKNIYIKKVICITKNEKCHVFFNICKIL